MDKACSRVEFFLGKIGGCGFIFSCAIGIGAFLLGKVVNSPLVECLLVALILGMVVGSAFGRNKRFAKGTFLTYSVFIPIGAILYGAINLDLLKIGKIDPSVLILLFLVIVSYFLTVLVAGRILGQKKPITYLIASGSGVCGASAIAISSPAVEAEPEDVSISLLSVFTVALFGLFILFPFLSSALGLSDNVYALLSGMTLQFTGFVKAAVAGLPKEAADLAISVKAVRYLVLLISIPVFASLTKKRAYAPWFLWAFLAAGAAFSFFPDLLSPLEPTFKILLDIFWSIAMAGIGLNTDVRTLFSDDGLKALGMAFAGFAVAVTTFFIGSLVIF